MIDASYTAGEVLEVMRDKTFVVACGDGLLHIRDYYVEGNSFDLCAGLKFNSISINQSANIIFERFKVDFPDKKVKNCIFRFIL